jgi:hypothetical protein
MTRKNWRWEVYRAADNKRESGEEWSRDRAQIAAEYAHRELGPKGVAVTVTSPRGTKYFLCPKERTSGMKWECRQ